jgi:alkylation response protein AidB-like acyl-CoA dehydrogenase
MDHDAAAVLGAARQLGPSLAARSDAIAANRTLPADVVADLVATGACKLFVPRRYGGAEARPIEGFRVIEELAYHDGATGWCAMIAATTGMIGGLLAPEHAVTIFGAPDAVSGGLAAPMGTATPVAGGVEVTGRWQWGSGTAHCTYIGGGCRVDGAGPRFVFFERADVELLDTWDVAGLEGTGSTDYRVERVFVPEGRWMELVAPVPVEDGPLYRFSLFGLLAVGIAAVGLGLARRSIDEFVTLAAVKTPQGSQRPLAERTPVQADVAIAEATRRAAAEFVTAAANDAWDTVAAGDEQTVEQRRLLRLASTHAMASAARTVDLMYTAAGGASVYKRNPLQRLFRDVHVATQHAMTAPRTYELAGRLRLGLETDTRQL